MHVASATPLQLLFDAGREAVALTERLADEQQNFSMFALGVGCAIDRMELNKLIRACGQHIDPDGRYLALAEHPESPW